MIYYQQEVLPIHFLYSWWVPFGCGWHKDHLVSVGDWRRHPAGHY
jgi:hypothetical protein